MTMGFLLHVFIIIDFIPLNSYFKRIGYAEKVKQIVKNAMHGSVLEAMDAKAVITVAVAVPAHLSVVIVQVQVPRERT